jgi:hypothetical protein
MSTYKIFCDESNHLLNDKANIMVNGALQIKEDHVKEANMYIKKLRHKYNYKTEIKWTKLIKKQLPFYKELIDYFFNNIHMNFKATLVVNKSNANHERYGRNHDQFYYVVYYYTLRDLLKKDGSHKIYFDYKDTLGGTRVKKLKEVLNNDGYSKIDFTIIHSYEAQLIQLSDLFIGAIGYTNREDIEKNSEIKCAIVDYLNEKIKQQGHNIGDIQSTKPWAEKFNIFRWSLSNV